MYVYDEGDDIGLRLQICWYTCMYIDKILHFLNYVGVTQSPQLTRKSIR